MQLLKTLLGFPSLPVLNDSAIAVFEDHKSRKRRVWLFSANILRCWSRYDCSLMRTRTHVVGIKRFYYLSTYLHDLCMSFSKIVGNFEANFHEIISIDRTWHLERLVTFGGISRSSRIQVVVSTFLSVSVRNIKKLWKNLFSWNCREVGCDIRNNW